MLSKDRKNYIAGAMSLLLLLNTTASHGAIANSVLDNIELVSPSGKIINNIKDLTRPLPRFEERTEDRPATWGDFVSLVGNKFNMNMEFILKYNKNRKELIITKKEFIDSYRLILEELGQTKANATSKYRINTVVQNIGMNRNYLNLSELQDILSRNMELNTKGELVEKLRVKIEDITGNSIKVRRIVGNTTSEQRFMSGLNRPWALEHRIYDINVVGTHIVEVEPVADILSGIVTQKGGKLYVNEFELDGSKNPKQGEFIEYTVIDSKAILLTTFGKFEGTYIVKSLDTKGVNTYEGKVLSKSLKVVNEMGIETAITSLNRNSIVSKFGDYLMVGVEQSDNDIRYYGGKVYIDNVGYTSSNLKITDGRKLQDVKDFAYADRLKSAKVTWDVLGTPKILEVNRIEYVAYIEDTKDNKITGKYTGGDLSAELDWTNEVDTLYRNSVYKLLIVDNKIVKAERVKATSLAVNRVYTNYIYSGSKRMYVPNETLVLTRDFSAIGTPNQEYTAITYETLLKEQDDKVKNGFMYIDVYSSDGETVDLLAVNYRTGEGGLPAYNQVLKPTPLNAYRVVSYNYEGVWGSTVTLTDGEKSATLGVPDASMLAGLIVGDYVTVHMSINGRIDWIGRLECTHENLIVPGLAGSLGMPSSILLYRHIVRGSQEEIALKTEYQIYENINGTLAPVDYITPLIAGRTYIAMRDGILTRITVGGGN